MLVPPYLGKSCGTGWNQIIGHLAIMRDSLTCSYSILTYIITTVLTGGAYPKCKLHFFNFSRAFLRPWTCNFTFWSAKKTLPKKGARYLGDVQRPIWPPKGALKGWQGMSAGGDHPVHGKIDENTIATIWNIDPTIFRGLEDAFPLTLGYFRVYESISIIRGW